MGGGETILVTLAVAALYALGMSFTARRVYAAMTEDEWGEDLDTLDRFFLYFFAGLCAIVWPLVVLPVLIGSYLVNRKNERIDK